MHLKPLFTLLFKHNIRTSSLITINTHYFPVFIVRINMFIVRISTKHVVFVSFYQGVLINFIHITECLNTPMSQFTTSLEKQVLNSVFEP